MAIYSASALGLKAMVNHRLVGTNDRAEIDEICNRWKVDVSRGDTCKSVPPEAVDEGAGFHEGNPIL